MKVGMARPPRLERGTLCLEGRCSIQLSYGRHLLQYNDLQKIEKRFLDDLILRSDTAPMSERKKEQNSLWQKTPYANLVRYKPSKAFFARIRINGKLIRRKLKATSLTVAKMKLNDLEVAERKKAENKVESTNGKMTFGQALATFRLRLSGDPSIKPRTRSYHEQRIKALQKSWSGLDKIEIRNIGKSDCLDWAARFSQKPSKDGTTKKRSATAFNHTVGILKRILEIGVEAGARYDNPARFVKRLSERPKKPTLPEMDQFDAFVSEIETSGSGHSRPCAELVRFMAFGGFRKTEAANITWGDCDFRRSKIRVKGDPETGTKNSEIREVPMIPDMKMLLERMRKGRKEESDGTPIMRVKECQKAMDRAAKVLESPRITHHDLRHLFATRCIESGVDIPTVSRWLGHKDGGALAMKVYGHLRDQHSVEMAQKVTFVQAAQKIKSEAG
jgi:integrase